MRVVELAERGARAAPVGLVLSHLAEEDETRPLQGLGDPGGIGDAVEGSAQVHHGDVRGILLWEWGILLLWKKASGRRALGAQRVAGLLFSQGHHLDHGTKTAAFTAAQASIAEGVGDVGHFLQEGLGDVEAVAANVEEGAAVAEAVLEVGQVVADAVEGAEPPDEAGGDLLAGGSRPELDLARHRALPHGGRQLSWEFRDSSHGEAYRRGSTMVMMGLAQDRAN
jgi:hypothetical protein